MVDIICRATIDFFFFFFQTKMKSEGKYVNLPGASHGNIVTRFPPEASGLVKFITLSLQSFF